MLKGERYKKSTFFTMSLDLPMMKKVKTFDLKNPLFVPVKSTLFGSYGTGFTP